MTDMRKNISLSLVTALARGLSPLVFDEEKETWNDTVFKRLFWHGYRGRTGSLFWPCQRDFEGIVDAVTDAEHFDRSEHRAWLSGKTAARQFGKLVADGTHLTLLTHSQGNVLVGEALRQLKKMNPQALGNITYLAWQGAISAQMYTTKYDVTDKTLKNEMASHDFAWLAVAHGNTQKWLQAINLLNPDTSAPDWFGYYPNGRGGYGPYLDGVLNELRYSKNFFNRYDYALNLWLGKQATRPDKLAVCPFGYTMGKVSYLDGDGKRQSFVPTNPRGRFYQNRPEGRMVIYPGDSSEVSGAGYPFYGNERVVKPLAAKDKDGEPFEGGELAKWCTFSFVVNSRSLAIGQVDMDGVFAECTNLEGKYQFTDRHYGHSFEFRSNICYTWWLWEEIIEGIRKNGKQEVKK